MQAFAGDDGQRGPHANRMSFRERVSYVYDKENGLAITIRLLLNMAGTPPRASTAIADVRGRDALIGATRFSVRKVSSRTFFGDAVVTADSPSRPRLVFDDPFRVIGYCGDPANEIGVLLWSGIDPRRYFDRDHRSEIEAFRHLLTLDFSGQVVAWRSAPLDGQNRQWQEARPESIEHLNRRIRETEPLRYRPAQPPDSPTPSR